MPYILNELTQVKLVMAGPDWGRRRNLERLALHLGVDSAVEFTGELSEEQKLKYLVSCDVFVHPSLQDVFSLSILEASAMSLPVVAFDTGGNPEMVLNGQTGILVKSHTTKALAEAIIKILVEPCVAKEMGQKARDYTLKLFSLENIVNELEQIYNSVLHSTNCS